MRKLVSLVFVFSIAMLFVLAVTPAFAKNPGSVAVDSAPAICDGHYQDRSICGSGIIWLNLSSGPEACNYTCLLSCNDGSTPPCDMADDASLFCDSASGNKEDQYGAFPFSYTSPTGEVVCSITVIATDCTNPDDEGTVGGDGFHSCEPL